MVERVVLAVPVAVGVLLDAATARIESFAGQAHHIIEGSTTATASDTTFSRAPRLPVTTLRRGCLLQEMR